VFPENTSNFEIKGLDTIVPTEFIKFPLVILRKNDIISAHIEGIDGGDTFTYTIIVTTKQKQNEGFCAAYCDTEEEAKAMLDEMWQNLNPPLAFSATVKAMDDVVNVVKGDSKIESEYYPDTFDFLIALKKLFEGKKVRVCSWSEHEYIYYDPDTKCIYDEVGFDFKGMLSWADDVWEEYKDGSGLIVSNQDN
jgi:hypothetical protein